MKKNNVENARATWEDAQRLVRERTAELGDVSEQIRQLDWSKEKQAATRLAELSQRREALPHLVKAAQQDEARAEITFRETELEAAEAQRPIHDERVDELQAAFDRARVELQRAAAARQELVIGRMSDIRRAKRGAERRLSALESQPVQEEKGPVVRSSWQRHRPGPENFIQDTPGALRLGSANVADKPLSAGPATESVVIPHKALAATKK
jgi:chromosome segregation ATPase